MLVLVVTIFSAELLVMSGLHFLDIPPLLEIVVDSAVLILLLLPILQTRVVRPMQARMDALLLAEQSLRQAHQELEQRVHERTVALTQANTSLQKEMAERVHIQEELERLATTDSLTGLRNRRAFESFANQELQRAARFGDALSIVLFDIDHFKRINDTFGHQAGDDVLVELSQLIGKRIRASEILARWGGEEFIILLPRTEMEGAAHLAGELRRQLQEHDFSQVGAVSASFGLTQYYPGDNLDSLVQRADTALYRAKANGRNRVEGESPSASP